MTEEKTMGWQGLRAFVAMALAVGLVGLFAGCGDSAPTAAEFARQVDAVCRETTKRLAAVPDDSTYARPVDHGTRTAATLKAMVRRLEGIDPPAELETEFARYRSAMKGYAQFANDAAGATGAASPEAQAKVQQDQRTLLVLARSLRLRDCS